MASNNGFKSISLTQLSRKRKITYIILLHNTRTSRHDFFQVNLTSRRPAPRDLLVTIAVKRVEPTERELLPHPLIFVCFDLCLSKVSMNLVKLCIRKSY